jgi:hypothetical protein
VIKESVFIRNWHHKRFANPWQKWLEYDYFKVYPLTQKTTGFARG